MKQKKTIFYVLKCLLISCFLFIIFIENSFSDDLFTSELVKAKSQVINWFQLLGSALFVINTLLLVMCYVSPFEALHNMKSKVTKAFVVTVIIYVLSSIFSGTIGTMLSSGINCPLMLIGGTCQ